MLHRDDRRHPSFATANAMPMLSGGAVVVEALLAHDVRQVFCVPGESYLAILDALYDVSDRIELFACRHESGAAMMALANARLRHRAGVCLVTRGPGATNAALAVHIADQASIPLVMLVGQVPRAHLGREAFQEVDYVQLFGAMARHVEQVAAPADLGAALTRAFHIAESGRAGPVIVALPEDVLLEHTPALPVARQAVIRGAPGDDDIALMRDMLGHAERPLILAGGGNWTDAASAALARFAGAHQIPVCTSFRRHDLFDNSHSSFAGYLGYGAHPAVWALADEADCVLVLGARLDDPSTQGYTLFRDDRERKLIHVYPRAREIGLNYAVAQAIVADVVPTMARLAEVSLVPARDHGAWCRRLRQAWLDASVAPAATGGVDAGAAMATLNRHLRDDAIISVDAGNFSRWPQRYRHYRRPGRLLAPINGAMGFGVPAAIGAALTCPERQVVGCVGDGGMLMTGNELATAARYGARPLIIVFNNARYGTIEMHQDQRYPGRRIGTALTNPDFAAFAQSFGLFGVRITRTEEFEPGLLAALAADTGALLELDIEGY